MVLASFRCRRWRCPYSYDIGNDWLIFIDKAGHPIVVPFVTTKTQKTDPRAEQVSYPERWHPQQKEGSPTFVCAHLVVLTNRLTNERIDRFRTVVIIRHGEHTTR